MEKAVVVFSGGQDSTTCLYWALREGFDVHTVTFVYGQRHAREVEAAHIIASGAGIPLSKQEVINLGDGILKSTSPLVSNNELEQYKDHASLPGGLEKTFVPMRNQLFLTVAANRAFAIGASFLVAGVCEEDYGGYPDCRQVFIDAFERACRLGTFTGESGYGVWGEKQHFKIFTPLMSRTKAATVKLALDIPGCYRALAYSHTAYDGQYPPVGKDHATLLRAKGFEEAGVPDPLILRACIEGLMDIPETENYSPAKYEHYGKLAGLILEDM